MGQPRPLLFIFVLFNHKFYRKTEGFSTIQTRIAGEGEHADHLTTTTASREMMFLQLKPKIFIFMYWVAYWWGRNGCSSPSTKGLHE